MLGCRKIFFIGSRRLALISIAVLLSVVIIAFEATNLSLHSSSFDTSVKLIVRWLVKPCNRSEQGCDHAEVPENNTLTRAWTEVTGTAFSRRDPSIRGFLLSVSVDQRLTGGVHTTSHTGCHL